MKTKSKKRSKSKRRRTSRTPLPAGSESYCYSRGALLMAAVRRTPAFRQAPHGWVPGRGRSRFLRDRGTVR